MGRLNRLNCSVPLVLLVMLISCSGTVTFQVETSASQEHRWEFEIDNLSAHPLQINVNGRVCDALEAGESLPEPLEVNRFPGEPFFFALRGTGGSVPLTVEYPDFDGTSELYRLTINGFASLDPVTVNYSLAAAP